MSDETNINPTNKVLDNSLAEARKYLSDFASGDYYIDVEDGEDKGFVYLVINKNTGVDEAICKLLPQAIDYVNQLNTSMNKVRSGKGSSGSSIQVVPAGTKLN